MRERPDRVHDVASGETIALGQLCVAGHAASKQAAFLRQFRSGDAMNRPAHPTVGQRGGIRGGYGRINVKCRDVGADGA